MVPASYVSRDLGPEGDAFLVKIRAPLYQVSWPGEEEYISPRCSLCIDKEIENG